ncbi:unnamed protein product, partial [Symbiodinium sp. KB8]
AVRARVVNPLQHSVIVTYRLDGVAHRGRYAAQRLPSEVMDGEEAASLAAAGGDLAAAASRLSGAASEGADAPCAAGNAPAAAAARATGAAPARGTAGEGVLAPLVESLARQVAAMCRLSRVSDAGAALMPHPGRASWASGAAAGVSDAVALEQTVAATVRRGLPPADRNTVAATYCGHWAELVVTEVEAVTEPGSGGVGAGSRMEGQLRDQLTADLRAAEDALDEGASPPAAPTGPGSSSGSGGSGSSSAALDAMDAHLMLRMLGRPLGGAALRKAVTGQSRPRQASQARASVGGAGAATESSPAGSVCRPTFISEAARPVEMRSRRIIVSPCTGESWKCLSESAAGHSVSTAATLGQSGLDESADWALSDASAGAAAAGTDASPAAGAAPTGLARPADVSEASWTAVVAAVGRLR